MYAKRILIGLMVFVMVVSSLTAVSAGMFDFLSGDSGLEDYDFDDFTMKVPSGMELNETDEANIGDGLKDAIIENGGEMTVNEIYSNPELVHKVWTDENNTISVTVMDLNEDGYDDADDAVNENFAHPTLIDESNGLKIYNLTSSSSGDVGVVSEGGNNLVVIVAGEDQELLTEMASSISFK